MLTVFKIESFEENSNTTKQVLQHTI